MLQVLFGGLRATVDGSQSKFFSFLFLGEQLGGMKKGKAAMHKNGVFNFFENLHGELTLPSKEDFITPQSAIQQIQKLTGARQVTL